MKAPPAGLVLLLTTLAWGSTFVVTASLLEDAPPLTYLALRFGVATLCLLPLAPRLRLTPGFFRDALVLGLFNSCGLLLQVLGQCYTTPAKSAFITSLNTPLTALGGLLLYREVPTRAQRLAIALASIGLCLLTWPPPGARINPGDLYTVGCAILFAFFIVESARRGPRHDAITLGVAQVTIAGALFVGCALLARAIHVDSHLLELEARPFPRGARVYAQMAYMTIVCVCVLMLVQTWALQRLPATTSAVIYSIEPVIATAMSMALGDAAPGPRGTTGAMLVLCAVYVAEGRELRLAFVRRIRRSKKPSSTPPGAPSP